MQPLRLPTQVQRRPVILLKWISALWQCRFSSIHRRACRIWGWQKQLFPLSYMRIYLKPLSFQQPTLLAGWKLAIPTWFYFWIQSGLQRLFTIWLTDLFQNIQKTLTLLFLHINRISPQVWRSSDFYLLSNQELLVYLERVWLWHMRSIGVKSYRSFIIDNIMRVRWIRRRLFDSLRFRIENQRE